MRIVNGRISITRAEVEMAEFFEMSPAEYVKSLLELKEEEAKFEAWLLTSPGTEYLANKEASRQRKLERDRNRMRNIRARKKAEKQEIENA